MAADPNSTSARRNSNSDLLQELEALSQTLYQSHTARRTASLVLPRDAGAKAPDPSLADHALPVDANRPDNRPRSRRMSMSPWRSRPKETVAHAHQEPQIRQPDAHSSPHGSEEAGQEEEKKKSGIWSWKPMRALSHMTMHRMSCLLSVEVIAVQGLPPSMNGLRLSVSVRKKDNRDGAVQTMPARVVQGAADFEETLFVRCSLYCSGGAGTGKPLKFEPRPFVLAVLAVDASELDFGKNAVDLSALVKESVDRSSEGARVRQWERSFRLSGKAKGGELVVKLGFQIMEDGGVGIYSLAEGAALGGSKGSGAGAGALARKQSKTSFSVSSPRMNPSSRFDATPSPKQYSPAQAAINFREIDDFNLDDPPASAPAPVPHVVAAPPAQAPAKVQDDTDFPDFEVVDKGVEIIEDDRAEAPPKPTETEEEKVEAADDKSEPSEVVVKEVVHQRRLTELDSIAQQIMALESMIGEGHTANGGGAATEPNIGLDADEETVTREFLQLLEQDDSSETDFKFDVPEVGTPKSRGSGKTGGGRTVSDEKEPKSFVSDLGKGLGPIVQTKDGGYLAAANPFDVEVLRRDTPKLAVQISKPLILVDKGSASGGFEVLQRMAAAGVEKLGSALLSAVSMDEIVGKTAEQVAFEGIASAIISGRNKLEGASSSAAKSVAALKEMGAALTAGRAERVRTGIWSTSEEPLAAEDVLTFALQRIESMAVESLKVQADMAEDEAPFDVFTLAGKDDPNWPLSSAVPLDEWKQESNETTAGSLTVLVVAQLRDPLRRYESVGAPAVGLIQAARSAGLKKEDEAEGRYYKVTSVHMGGLRLQLTADAGRKGGWDGQSLRQSAAQWLTAYGLGKAPAGRKGKVASSPAGKAGQDLLWSLSSRLMADMWLRPMRNPDIKFPRQ